ncbi:MAG: DUF4397 domain-containing protein [Bacteroidetes bacterium]|nr:MAG: DUF4397 domain-containing protein [Bacteroidota bacterium]
MKRFTLLLTVVFFSIAAFGQSHYIDPQDYEKLKQHNLITEQEKSEFDSFLSDEVADETEQFRTEEVQQLSIDRPTHTRSMVQPGFVQQGFRDGETGYAWNIFAGASGVPTGPVSINLETGVLTLIQAVDGGVIWMAAGDIVDETWYTVSNANPAALYTVDPSTGDYTQVGSTGLGSVTGLAYDVNTNIMYASQYDGTNSQLYTVNLATGATTLVGQITSGSIVISIAMDSESNMYAAVLNDNSLYSVNPATGAGTLIGALGVTINFAQDIAYDRDNEILYGALYSDFGGLYTINTETGAATMINNFVAEVAGFAIPYTTAEDDAPAAVVDLEAAAGAEGALEVTLTWTNPSTQFDGEPLTELTSVVVERGGEVIETFADPVIGGEVTFVDDDIDEAGIYNYRVYGVNSAGDGPATSVSLYVGEDVPAAPGDVTLVADGNDGFVTWSAPTEGLNGGYLSGEGITYTIVRMPDNVEVAEDITETEFLDTTVPGVGNYFYMVTASNDIGVGGSAASNIALLGAEGILMFEPFDYPTGAIPPGWELTGVAHAWSVFNTANAGGEAPELRLNWSPASTGMSRLVTYPVNVEDFTELRLTFRQFLNNFGTNEGEIAAIDVTFDGGETWDALWEIVIEDNVPVGLYELFVDVPPGKSTLHFGFRFDGNSFNINQWYIDDMILEPVLDNDLAAFSIDGPVIAPVGVESMYTIQVQNAGTQTQDNYTVKLMGEGGVEISSVAGTTIEFAEILSFELPWTPVTEDAGDTYVYGVVEFEDDEAPGNNQTENFEVFVQPENDLVALSIAGNTTPSVGTESIYTIGVFNAGPVTQSDYEVKLMAEGDVELASVAGTTIEMNDTIFFQLPWTPELDDEGPMVIYGYVDFDDDELPDNNQTGNLNIVVQPGDIIAVTIGDGEVLTTQPYNFVWHYSIQQTLYYPAEIGLGGGVITGIQYVNSFNEDQLNRDVMIWMGETDLENLADGWVDPSTLQLVFDGQVDFPEGVNNIFIPLDEFYVYNGGNLVIYNYKMDDVWSSGKNFFNTLDAGSNRTRGAQQDNNPYDPANPPAGTARSNFPNITMFFSLEGLGGIEGTVTDGTDPLEGVLVSIMGTSLTRITDENGFYEFPTLIADTYNVEFSKFGYETVVVEGVVVVEDEVTIVDAVVPALDQFTVSGVVQGNDGVLIEEAQISMVGYDNYAATTDENGAFSIEDVFGGTYTLTVMAPGYETFVDEDVVIDADTDLGTIEVIEIIVPPFGLAVDTVGLPAGSALLTWNEAELLMLFQHDVDIPAEPNAFFQTDDFVYGTIFDLAAYPDAVVSHIDFHHLQWGIPVADYDFLVHIVDWANFEVIETIGPLTTTVNDDWEEEVMLGMVNVAGYDQVGILIQPQGHIPSDAYPCITTDATGPSGLSIRAPFNNLAGYIINGPTVGDYFINLWISTAFGGDKIVKADGLVSDNLEPVETRNGISVPSSEVTLTQNFWEMMPADKVFEGFNVFLNDVEVASGITENQHMFTGLPGGSHVAGVQSVYTTGESEIVTIEFEVEGPSFARAQIIHNSADAAVANVDIYVNGELVLPNVGFRQATPFIDIVAGVPLELHIAPAGADFEDALGPIEVMFTPGETYVVVAAGIVSDTGYEPAEPFGLFVFDQGQEAAVEPDNTDVLAFHGSTDAPEVSVWAMDVANALIPSFEFGDFAGYLPLPTNDYVLEIRDASGDNIIVAYTAPLATLELDGQALVVVASGFLNPDNNSGGPGFGLWVATSAGGDLIELPLYDDVSVEDITLSEGNISLFPNPVRDVVTLSSTIEMQDVRIYDVSGRLVYSNNIFAAEHQVNIEQFDAGMYFVQIVTSEGIFTGKLQIHK